MNKPSNPVPISEMPNKEKILQGIRIPGLRMIVVMLLFFAAYVVKSEADKNQILEAITKISEAQDSLTNEQSVQLFKVGELLQKINLDSFDWLTSPDSVLTMTIDGKQYTGNIDQISEQVGESSSEVQIVTNVEINILDHILNIRPGITTQEELLMQLENIRNKNPFITISIFPFNTAGENYIKNGTLINVGINLGGDVIVPAAEFTTSAIMAGEDVQTGFVVTAVGAPPKDLRMDYIPQSLVTDNVDTDGKVDLKPNLVKLIGSQFNK